MRYLLFLASNQAILVFLGGAWNAQNSPVQGRKGVFSCLKCALFSLQNQFVFAKRTKLSRLFATNH